MAGKWSSEATVWLHGQLYYQLAAAEMTKTGHVSASSGVNEVVYSVTLIKEGLDIGEQLVNSGHARGKMSYFSTAG